jgi:hypothetical protein
MGLAGALCAASCWAMTDTLPTSNVLITIRTDSSLFFMMDSPFLISHQYWVDCSSSL